MNKNFDIEETLWDLKAVQIMLANMSQTYGLEKTTLDVTDELRLIKFHTQIDEIINFAIRTIDNTVNNILTITYKKDSNESESTTETTKNQK